MIDRILFEISTQHGCDQQVELIEDKLKFLAPKGANGFLLVKLSAELKSHGGSTAQWCAYLPPDPAAPGLNRSPGERISSAESDIKVLVYGLLRTQIIFLREDSL